MLLSERHSTPLFRPRKWRAGRLTGVGLIAFHAIESPPLPGK
jgi:hypothetical protein